MNATKVVRAASAPRKSPFRAASSEGAKLARQLSVPRPPLEVEFHTELQLTRAGCEVIAPDLRRRLPKNRVIDDIVRLVEVRMIEQVVVFGPKFHGETLRNFGVF